MLYWDSSHPTGVTIPLRQPNPPVYYNVPEKESPSMSGSQSPTSEMTLASSSSELSGEEAGEQEDLSQQLASLSFNQAATAQQEKTTGPQYQYSAAHSAYYTWNGTNYDISGSPAQHNGDQPTNRNQYIGQSKQVNGHTNQQMTGNLNYQMTMGRPGMTGSSSEMTGTGGNCQVYPQTSQMPQQNNIQVT